MAVTLGLAAPAAANVQTAAASEQAFAALVAEHWEAMLREHPLLASDSGDRRYDDRLERVRPEDMLRRGRLAADYLARLKRIDPAGLTPRRRVSYRTLERELTLRAAMGSGTRGFLLPRLYPINWRQTFIEYAHRVRLSDADAYRAYIARLGAFAQQMDDFRALTETGLAEGYTQPCRSLELFTASLREDLAAAPAASGYFAPFRSIPAGVAPAEAERLKRDGEAAIRERVYPALQRLLAFAEGPYSRRCRIAVALSEVPEGGAWYATLARHFTTTDTPVTEIQALGRSEVARLRREMEAVKAEAGFTGDFAAFVAFLRTDPRFYPASEADYLARAATVAKQVDGVLPRYFATADLPRAPFVIEPIPAQLAPGASATNYYPPSEPERKPGIYYLNTHDLKARPLYELPSLTLHNAMPGHHLQITRQQEMTDLPPQVRFGDMVAYTEGWSLYAEWLGGEMGLYQDPYVRFGQLNMEMWRALRLVVDPGLHLQGWSRQQAIDYMMENSAMSRTAVEHEVDRYISWPAQSLSYRLGDLKIRELRRRAETALGPRFSLPAFHTVVLENGTVPLSVLEEVVDAWISRQAQMGPSR